MIKLLVLAGPSAVGKTTVAHEILSADSRFSLSRSATTRAPRGDGYDSEYIYLSRTEFERRIASGEVLEYTEYAGAYYGTPHSEIERIDKEGKIPLLILDRQGVASLSHSPLVASCSVYIYDDISVMEERLRKRFETDSSPERESRLKIRLDKNLADYREILDTAPHLYAFVKNGGTPNETALAVIEVFSDFCLGASRDSEAIVATVANIIESVKNK